MAANFKAVLWVKGVVKDQAFFSSKRAARLWTVSDEKDGSKSVFLNLTPKERVYARVEVFEIQETLVAVHHPSADYLPESSSLVPAKAERPCKYPSGCISEDCKTKRDANNEPRICEQQ